MYSYYVAVVTDASSEPQVVVLVMFAGFIAIPTQKPTMPHFTYETWDYVLGCCWWIPLKSEFQDSYNPYLNLEPYSSFDDGLS